MSDLSNEVKLGVNIDHIATVRQARGGTFPSVVDAALVAERAGAESITVHLREDRRHIQDEDVRALKKKIKTKLNLEMSIASSIVSIACKIRPADVCIVPEKREELTTEGGLDVCGSRSKIKRVVQQLKEAGICVSLFVDPVKKQIEASKEVGADAVELHTGCYANAKNRLRNELEFRKLVEAGRIARQLGLTLNAGHGLDYDNVRPIAKIEGMNELNIGFSIIARSLFVGLRKAVSEMKRLIK